MRLMRIYCFGILLFYSGFAAVSQGRLIQTGEIPGYVTLKCDFHTHTVFSDGDVWPTFRIREAVRDGLDVLSITDHLEYQPKKAYVKGDDNSAFALARKNAVQSDLILIRGTEITRRMPPGHLNALFLPDSIVFGDTALSAVVKKAAEAGAFIQWNHPGWKAQQPDGIPRLTEMHMDFILKGWLNGIEIFNDREFYPDVMEWCLANGLAMIGNTDIHGTTDELLSITGDSHRTMTLVFARERKAESVKEALFDARTLVWYGDTLAGRADLAGLFVLGSLRPPEVIGEDEKYIWYRLENPTDIPFFLVDGKNPGAPVSIDLKANSYRIVRVRKEEPQELVYTVGNIKTGTSEKLQIRLQ